MKIIITGATGMVGEGVLIECLYHKDVSSVLYVGRKPSGKQHPRLSEYIIPDFLSLNQDDARLSGYDACFYCVGISSLGMKENEYSRITYDLTLHFANILHQQNPGLVFNFVSSEFTDSTEKGSSMWKRVKGKTENALGKVGFRDQYNFRPGLMMPDPEQVHLKAGYNRFLKIMYMLFSPFHPGCTIREVGRAMIVVSKFGYPSKILEVRDIKKTILLN